MRLRGHRGGPHHDFHRRGQPPRYLLGGSGLGSGDRQARRGWCMQLGGSGGRSSRSFLGCLGESRAGGAPETRSVHIWWMWTFLPPGRPGCLQGQGLPPPAFLSCFSLPLVSRKRGRKKKGAKEARRGRRLRTVISLFPTGRHLACIAL